MRIGTKRDHVARLLVKQLCLRQRMKANSPIKSLLHTLLYGSPKQHRTNGAIFSESIQSVNSPIPWRNLQVIDVHQWFSRVTFYPGLVGSGFCKHRPLPSIFTYNSKSARLKQPQFMRLFAPIPVQAFGPLCTRNALRN